MSRIYHPTAEIRDGNNAIIDVDIHSITVSDSHEAATSTAIIDIDSDAISIGDEIKIYLGYDGTNTKVFGGYAKQVERRIPTGLYTITANGYMVRGTDYYFVAGNPDEPFTRNHIQAEDLIEAVIAEAGLTSYDGDTSYFELYTNSQDGIQVNLVTAQEFCKNIATILTWHIWCDEDGTVHFRNRKPYVMDGNSGTPGDVADSPIGYTWVPANDIDFTIMVDEKNLRNRVVVYAGEITAIAQESSDWLTPGFYKSVMMGCTGMIDDQYHANLTARYNLNYLHRLTYTVNTTVLGDPLLLPRRVIDVQTGDLGITDMNGYWYIYGVQHSFESGQGYTTSLTLKR